MREYANKGDLFSHEAIERYRALRNNRPYQLAKWTRNFHKEKQERRSQEALFYPAPQVGFGATFTHSFLGDAEDTESGSNLDYQA